MRQTFPTSSTTLSVSVTLALDRKAYQELQLNQPQLVQKSHAGHARDRKATTDSGAQLTVLDVHELHILGTKNFATSVNTVTKSSVDLLVGVFLIISASDPETKYEEDKCVNYRSRYQKMHERLLVVCQRVFLQLANM